LIVLVCKGYMGVQILRERLELEPIAPL
jgi:hypothetical protein